MKNTSLILSIISLIAVVTFGIITLTKDGKKAEQPAEGSTAAAAEAGAIVYVDLDRILTEYDMANDLRSVVETKVQNIQAEVTRRGQKLEKEVASYQEKIQKGLMTRSVAEVQGQKLQQQEIDFNNYAAQKQQEINEEQVVMMNQLGDAIQTFITKYNEEKQYAMILTNSGGAPVIAADAALDITEDVLAGLNEEYIKTKNEKSEE
ncbi:MAG: OmpH family outer membrane protein [Bacteroidales bacterium]|nr:OmpH family outer membrane protein [Bacteroidales bacterium]MBQ8574023.1 OmpH family outer membrane protein [Bacteroidales bacterium]MBR1959077.1 OmpH family outer membrane protein [Bacteroidales bacterium]